MQAAVSSPATVTRALISLNVAVFVVQLVLVGWHSLLRLPGQEVLAFGASYPLATIGENRWETLVTACFLHDGLPHIAFNMVVLWQAGPPVERLAGSARLAPMYLVAGAFGNLLCTAAAWLQRSAQPILGASGAIAGVVAAGLVASWRVQGWRGPLTQAMARWFGFLLVVGVITRMNGGHAADAAHVGGAVAGAVVAATWQRGYRYSRRATSLIVASCASVVVGSIVALAIRDHSDPFATMDLRDREDFTKSALADGRCGDAYQGLFAVERLRAKMAPVTSLANQVHAVCGHRPEP
jgi:rhomboid protease GluP